MRLIDRHDTSLAVGLIAGALVVFQQPLRFLLDMAGEIEQRYRLDLIPALVVLSVVFVFHQYRKRQASKVEAMAAAAEARSERARAEDLEQLVTLGRSLANALDFTSLRDALWRHLPSCLQRCHLWIVLRDRDGWRVIVEDTDTAERLPPDTLENVSVYALSQMATRPEATTEGIRVERYTCYPMQVGQNVIGMFVVAGLPEPTGVQQRALGAALAFLGITMRNVQLIAESRENSVRDGLTQWFNRAHAMSTLQIELKRSARNGAPLSILMFDIDHFKTLNDRYGHQHGDAVLMAVTRQAGQMLRMTDVKCRYGGDEFLVILPETPASGAEQVAEQLRRAVASLPVVAGSEMLGVTTSIGVATAAPGELDPKEIVDRADQALYRAKREGRNRVGASAGGDDRRLALVSAR